MANKKISDAKLQAGAEKALKEAVRGVIEDHKRTGRPVVIWRDGKVVKVPASQLLRKYEHALRKARTELKKGQTTRWTNIKKKLPPR